MRQAQGWDLADRAELELGDEPPSQYLADQIGNIGPGVVVGEPQSERSTLSGLAMPMGQLPDFVIGWRKEV